MATQHCDHYSSLANGFPQPGSSTYTEYATSQVAIEAILHDGDKRIGHLLGRVIGEGDEKRAQIRYIHVEEEYRLRKIGHELVKYFVKLTFGPSFGALCCTVLLGGDLFFTHGAFFKKQGFTVDLLKKKDIYEDGNKDVAQLCRSRKLADVVGRQVSREEQMAETNPELIAAIVAQAMMLHVFGPTIPDLPNDLIKTILFDYDINNMSDAYHKLVPVDCTARQYGITTRRPIKPTNTEHSQDDIVIVELPKLPLHFAHSEWKLQGDIGTRRQKTIKGTRSVARNNTGAKRKMQSDSVSQGGSGSKSKKKTVSKRKEETEPVPVPVEPKKPNPDFRPMNLDDVEEVHSHPQIDHDVKCNGAPVPRSDKQPNKEAYREIVKSEDNRSFVAEYNKKIRGHVLARTVVRGDKKYGEVLYVHVQEKPDKYPPAAAGAMLRKFCDAIDSDKNVCGSEVDLYGCTLQHIHHKGELEGVGFTVSERESDDPAKENGIYMTRKPHAKKR